jgi:hypothetical protein
VANHDHGQPLLAAQEAAAQRHTQLRDVEEVGGSGLAPHAFRLALAADGCGQQFVITRHTGKCLSLRPQVGE